LCNMNVVSAPDSVTEQASTGECGQHKSILAELCGQCLMGSSAKACVGEG
jgi:hypothetical protein